MVEEVEPAFDKNLISAKPYRAASDILYSFTRLNS